MVLKYTHQTKNRRKKVKATFKEVGLGTQRGLKYIEKL